MATIYVAMSRALASWGADVGLTKHIYKVGVAEGSAEAAVAALNATAEAGQTDWKHVAGRETGAIDEAAVLARLAQRERAIDPALYPKIKGARGLYKVKPGNVENHILVKRAFEDAEIKAVVVKPADVGGYLIANALD
jgi:hypothetical protein